MFTAGTDFPADSLVTSISWNRFVPYILVSAFDNGTISVWDLKSYKSIFTFQDPAAQTSQYSFYSQGDEGERPKKKNKYSVVWNPENPTQFLVASDSDEQEQSMRIWDLRNPECSLYAFQGRKLYF